jgi:hypothetical protein
MQETVPDLDLLSMQKAGRKRRCKKRSQTLTFFPCRKRAENEELLKAQRKAVRHAALEHKGEETRSPEELVGQVVWAKVGTYPWWPAQVIAHNPDLSHCFVLRARSPGLHVRSAFQKILAGR